MSAETFPTFKQLLGHFTFDPVMRKECTGLSRRWTMYAFRFAYVLILILVIWTLWVDYRRYMHLDATAYSRMGRDFFHLFTGWQFALLALGGIAWTSDMVAKEVRANTLGVLTATPLSPMKIVLGKWKSSLGYLSVVILAGLPILALGIALGSVDPLDLARVTLITLSMAMMCAALGMFVSTLSTSSFACLMGGIAGMVILSLTPIFMAFLDDGPNYVKIAAYLHPAYAIVATTADARFFGVFAEKWSWLTSFVSSMAFSLVLLGFASRRLTTLSRRVPRPPLIRRMFEGLDRYFSNHRLGISIWRSQSSVWDWNPLLWKELRYRMTGRLHYVIRIFVVILIIFVVLFLFMGENVLRSEFHLTGYTLLTVLMVLASMGAGATSFTREKELNQWDMLRTIPVHPESMVRAKLGGGLASLLPFAGLYALGGLGIIAMSSIRQGHRDDGVAWTLIVTTACFCTFLVSLGLYLSARFDTTKKALGWTLAATVFFLILIPILVSLADLRRDEDRLILAWTNPFYHVSALSQYGWDRRDGNYIGGVFGHALIYLSMSAILVKRCVARIRMATV